jgi:2-methylcitrate dehydratase
MKLPADKLVQAVNIAINDHIPMGQTRAQTNSDWKGLAAPEAGRNAVFAAVLARGGITGPAPIFEGRKGFFQLVSGPGDVAVDGFGGKSVQFRIHQCGMKPYPAVIYSQTGRDPEKWTPENRDTADHSLPYITARAMFEGDIDNDSYEHAKLHDPRTLAFMRKIKVSEDPALTARTGPSTVPTRTTAILVDGQRVTREVDDVPGFVGRPMGRADVEHKFRSNVGKRWPKEKTDAVLKALWALDETKDLSALLRMFSLQA